MVNNNCGKERQTEYIDNTEDIPSATGIIRIIARDMRDMVLFVLYVYI